MLPSERHVYDTLAADYGQDARVAELLLDHFVQTTLDYAGELIDADKYWTQVAAREVWLEELEPLVREATEDYLTELDQQLDETSGKLDEPYSDGRLRTIAATETTMARTLAAILLNDLNNTLAAVAQGRV